MNKMTDGISQIERSKYKISEDIDKQQQLEKSKSVREYVEVTKRLRGVGYFFDALKPESKKEFIAMVEWFVR